MALWGSRNPGHQRRKCRERSLNGLLANEELHSREHLQALLSLIRLQLLFLAYFFPWGKMP